MKIIYDSNDNERHIQLTISDDEHTKDEILLEESLHFLSKFVIALASQISNNPAEQDDIIELMLKSTLDYTKDFCKKSAEEERMYGIMEEVYEEYFLSKLECSEDQFLKEYKESLTPIKVVIDIDRTIDMINIGFSHTEKIENLIMSFPISIVKEDDKEFDDYCNIIHIIRTVAGDRIYGEDNNPFRKYVYDGTANFGLATEIKEALL